MVTAAVGQHPGESRLPLLESKLAVPRRREGLISRAALVDRLRASRWSPVLVVSAPAGYGKTTAIAEWVAGERRQVAWYSIDEQDADPAVFVTYVAEALRRAGAERVTGGAGVGEAFASLGNPAVIVLDNVHLLESRASLDALGELIAHVPPRSQLVLVTRRPLDSRPAARCAEGGALELGLDDLRLSDGEAIALLRAAGVSLGEAAMRGVNRRCEGWAVGLYLAALVERRSGSLADDSTLGGDRFVSDYFHTELLDRLADGDRDFLLEISVLDRVSGSLCDTMLGTVGSARRLASLAAANTFIVALDGEPGWFRLHPVFREMLEAELDRRRAGRRGALLLQATEWFTGRGDVNAAIECAVAASDAGRVAALCAAALPSLYWNGSSASVERWFSAIDDRLLLAEHPAVAALGSATFALSGRPEAAERWARTALRGDREETMPDGAPAEPWRAHLRALLCADGVDAMRADAELAVETLPDGSSLQVGAQLLAGFAYLLAGDEEQARARFGETVDAALELGAHLSASLGLAALSLLAAAANETNEADDLARRACRIVDEAALGGSATSAFVYAVDARVALARGLRLRAIDDIARAERLVPRLTVALPWIAVLTRLELARLHIGLTGRARARELADEIDEILVRRPDLGVAPVRAAGLRRELDTGGATGAGWASTLTAAELRLLPLLASYLSFREIADRLGISRNTVKTQAISAYRKLNVSSRSEAVDRARTIGLLG